MLTPKYTHDGVIPPAVTPYSPTIDNPAQPSGHGYSAKDIFIPKYDETGLYITAGVVVAVVVGGILGVAYLKKPKLFDLKSKWFKLKV